MSLPTILTVSSAAMLMLGFNMVVPLSEAVDTICIVAGIFCVVLFIGLIEDAGANGSRSGDRAED